MHQTVISNCIHIEILFVIVLNTCNLTTQLHLHEHWAWCSFMQTWLRMIQHAMRGTRYSISLPSYIKQCSSSIVQYLNNAASNSTKVFDRKTDYYRKILPCNIFRNGCTRAITDIPVLFTKYVLENLEESEIVTLICDICSFYDLKTVSAILVSIEGLVLHRGTWLNMLAATQILVSQSTQWLPYTSNIEPFQFYTDDQFLDYWPAVRFSCAPHADKLHSFTGTDLRSIPNNKSQSFSSRMA